MINRTKRYAALFIFFLLVFTLFSQIYSSNVIAQENNEVKESSEPRLFFIGKLIKALGAFATTLVPIFRLSVVAVAANPPYVEIGYNETVEVEVGLWDVEGGEDFEVFDRDFAIFTNRFINFEVLEYPGGNEYGSWFVVPDPFTVNVEKGAKLKTNLSISLIKPPIRGKAIQSGILKVRLLDTWAYGNLYFPPKGSPQDKFPNKWFWFISAAITMRFGKFSGTEDVEFKDVDILVKIKPYHAVRFDTSPTVYIKPNEIASIPITVQNLGNYNDTFGFRIKSKNNDIRLASPSYITLAPGETQQTYLAVSAPQSAFDYGTLREIVLETYSIDDEKTVIAEKQVFIETKGIYVNEAGGMGILFLIIIGFLFIAYLNHRKKLRISKYISKPDKPWEIPEERKYLEKLKKKDKNKYKETLKMMEDEYESSLLWYRSYCNSILKPKPVKKKKVKKEKSKKDKLKLKKEKEEPKKEKPKKEKSESSFLKYLIETEEEKKEKIKRKEEKKKLKEEKEQTIKEIKEEKVDKKQTADEIKKQKLISKIQKRQEKQMRKLKK